ncbi:MAG: hypothetical protein IPM20_12675 [Gammaproteobacteria bacterium]|nr:hypothetical protein [Gammaproteobacteria bacterium]
MEGLINNLFVNFVVKLLGRFIPWSIRWLFPPARLSKLIKIQIAGQSRGIEYWAGDLPKIRVYLEVINLSPFVVEIDRIFGHFNLGSQVASFAYLRRAKVLSPSEVVVFIEADLSDNQIKYIRTNKDAVEKAGINLIAEFNCKVNDFT